MVAAKTQPENLKPCPFCGGKAHVWRTNYHVFIECENWCANEKNGLHMIQISADTMQEAVKIWNERKEIGTEPKN